MQPVSRTGPARNASNRKNKPTPDQARLLDEYYSALARIHTLRNTFQNVTDPDLIAACVYELNAAQQQFSYLLVKLKEENVSRFSVLR